MNPIRLRLAMAVLGLALATPIAAQQTPAPEAPEPEAPAPAAPSDAIPVPEEGAEPAPAGEAAAPADPDAPAPAGEAAPPAGAGAAGADPAQPVEPEVMEIVRDTFGDWQVRCAPDGNECFMYQLARDAEDNPVAEVSLLKLPEASEAAAGVTVVTPLGTLLPQGVMLQIDTGEQRQYPFAWCSQVGCFARFGLTDEAVNSLRRGRAGKIGLVAVTDPDQPVTLDLSLTGFTDAYNSLEVPAPRPMPGPRATPGPGAPAAPAAPDPLAPAPLAPRAPAGN